MTTSEKEKSPAVIRSGAGSSNSYSAAGRIWVQISAFLSLKAPETQRTYSGVLGEWCRFLSFEPGTDRAADAICSATDLHAAAYRSWLTKQSGEKPRAESRHTNHSREIVTERHRAKKSSGLESTQSNATIHKKFAALRRIYRVLIAHGFAKNGNPFDTDRTPAPPKDAARKRPTQMVDFTMVWEIVNAPIFTESGEATPKQLRDRAILALLFGAGLRRSEVSALRMIDARATPSGTPYLYLRSTKAKRDAEQALPKWGADFLNEYLKIRKNDGAVDSDPIFVGYTGQAGVLSTNQAISDAGIYSLFKSYCMRVGAGPYVTPHSARATAITKLLADGIPHREVQDFSRHASIQMVEHYDKRRFDVEKSVAKGLDFRGKA